MRVVASLYSTNSFHGMAFCTSVLCCGKLQRNVGKIENTIGRFFLQLQASSFSVHSTKFPVYDFKTSQSFVNVICHWIFLQMLLNSVILPPRQNGVENRYKVQQSQTKLLILQSLTTQETSFEIDNKPVNIYPLTNDSCPHHKHVFRSSKVALRIINQ